MTRYILRLVVLSTLIIMSPGFVSASDAASVGKIKLAMGPMSSALKNQNQGQQAAPGNTTGTTPKLHHHTKHKPKPDQ
jgi:hypothetical protein